MKGLRLWTCLTGLLLPAVFAAVAHAGDLEDGVAAFGHGDYPTALRLLQPLADRGNPEAQYALGDLYWYRHNYPKMLKWLHLAADQGNTTAQRDLGTDYEDGIGVPQDYSEAHKWFNISAAIETNPTLRQWSASDRDRVARKMTAEQIAEAQKLAREWWKAAKPLAVQ